MSTTKAKKSSFKDAIAERLGDRAKNVYTRLGPACDDHLVQIEARARTRFPNCEKSRVAWGTILVQNRASIKAPPEDVDHFYATTGLDDPRPKAKPPQKQKAAAKA